MSTDTPEVFCLKGQLDRKNALTRQIGSIINDEELPAEDKIEKITAAINWHINNEKGGK